MTKLKQFDLLEIMEFEQEEFGYPKHGQNYYEIMYILEGKGVHHQNTSKVVYTSGDAFIILPSDEHYFVIEDRTVFFAIKFTDSYVEFFKQQAQSGYIDVRKMMSRAALQEQALLTSSLEKAMLARVVENIRVYPRKAHLATSVYIYHQLMAFIALILESAGSTAAVQVSHGSREDQLLSFIHQHICDPHKLTVKCLAAEFNISFAYFGKFFKRSYGISLREYIQRYKYELVKKRIDSREYTLKQIAVEFGFTDESHVHKFYHKIAGSSNVH